MFWYHTSNRNYELVEIYPSNKYYDNTNLYKNLNKVRNIILNCIPNIIFPNIQILNINCDNLNNKIISFLNNHQHINVLTLSVNESETNNNIINQFFDIINQMHLESLNFNNCNFGNKFYLLKTHIPNIDCIGCKITSDIKYYLEHPQYDTIFFPLANDVNDLIQIYAYEPNNVYVYN